MTRNLTRQFGWVWINMILLACLPSIASAQTIPCAPNCQDINVSITGTGPNEFHAKIAWTDFIRNFDCAAPVTYTLQTISGANVARGSSDDAGNEVYFIVGNPCDYLDRELMLTVTNALGSCMSMVTFHKGMLNFSGRSFDYYCLDPNVEAPQVANYPDPFMACDGLVIPRWVADWPFTKDCSGATVDTAKVIFREWEVIDKDGMRYVAYDTITVHRLPALDREHLYCQAQDTLYCGESPLFGPYLVIPSAPGSLDCDTIPLVSVHNDSGRITFQAMELNQSCGFQMHLDTMRFSTGCNSMYRLDLEIKQICPGLPNPALCLVPLNNDIEQVDASGAYWRCSFWVLDIDTLPPVARCDYSKFGSATVLWPDKADDDQPGHCFSTPANPGTQLNAPIVVLSTYSHQCAALATLPDLCIEDDWSGIGQVKAQINGIGSYVLQPGISCDSGVIYTFDGVVELPMREQPYQILYEVRDACHNVDSIYCYVLVKDGTKPTAIAAKGVTVALGGKTTWVEAQSFDEGSFDACQINLLLARRTDWFTAGVDLCDKLDSLCTFHDEVIYAPSLETDKNLNPIEAHYARTLQWFEEDGGPCSNVLLNAWRFGLLRETYRHCTDGHLTSEEFSDLFKSGIHGCQLPVLPDGESLGCATQVTDFDRMLDQAAQIGGGWSDAVPFTCDDACQIIPVEILAVDYWCNWSKSWTEVKVEDLSPVTIAQELEDHLEITCKTYRQEQVGGLSIEELVELAGNDDPGALTELDKVFGTYSKVWLDQQGKFIDAEGNAVVTEKSLLDSVCICGDSVLHIEIFDEHLGHTTEDITYGFCNYIDSIKSFAVGIVTVNCAQNVQCSQTVWSDFDHCGQGVIYRKFKIWSGCPPNSDLAGLHPADTIERVQRIFVNNSCLLDRSMFDLPSDVEVYSCGVEYKSDASGQVVGAADPELTGAPTYRFDDDCRIIGVAHEDRVFKVVGGDQACYKILRTWYLADWCVTDGQHDGNWWKDDDLVLDTFIQKIIVVDTIPPACIITGPVEDGAIIEVAGCLYDFSAELDVMDECGVIRYVYELTRDTTEVIARDEGDLNTMEQDQSTISIPGLEAGTYLLKIRVTDACQNESYCQYGFTVEAGKKPSPVCITSITVDLIPEDIDGDGLADTATAVVWANEFDRSSIAPCGENTEDLQFFIEVLRPDNPGFQSFDPEVDLDYVNIGCGDIGVQVARMWVLSPTGSIDFCDVILRVQNNMGGCPIAGPVVSQVDGAIVTADSQLVEGVEVSAISLQVPDQMVLSDQNGSYSFVFNQDDEIEITPFKDGDDLNGINTSDLLALANHTNRSKLIVDPYLRIAADVNFDQSISVPDLRLLRDVILSNVPGFEDGTSWRFVQSDFAFQSATPEAEDFPESRKMALDKTFARADFVAMKIGDLTLDRNTKFAGRSGDVLGFEQFDSDFISGDEIVFSPKLNVRANLAGMQFELHFDPEKLQFAGIDNGGILNIQEEDFGLRYVEKGVLYFCWLGDGTQALNKIENLFSIRFSAKSSGRLSNTISFRGDRLDAEGYLSEKIKQPIALTFKDSQGELSLQQNFPNPFTEKTRIDFVLTESMKVSFTVTDLTGKIILRQEKQYESGDQSIQIDRDDLGSTGIYLYSIRTPYDMQTRKMALVR